MDCLRAAVKSKASERAGSWLHVEILSVKRRNWVEAKFSCGCYGGANAEEGATALLKPKAELLSRAAVI